jgi:DNA-binding transcriptional MerR regulator
VFRIGDFSRVCRIPVSTLRYYADIGLLIPIHIDPFTGYRYYSLEQLPRLNRILALRDLGFTLEQIGPLLEGEITPLDLLRQKQAELKQHIQEEQERFARITAHIAQIEREGHMPSYDVIVKPLEKQIVASIRHVIPTIDDMGPRCGEMFKAVVDWVIHSGIQPAGPTLSIYYNEEYTETDIDVETAFVINGATVKETPPPTIQIRELPAVSQAASVIHQGDYANLIEAWQALGRWIEANGYEIAGPGREVYLSRPGEPPVAEVQYPVQKGAFKA